MRFTDKAASATLSAPTGLTPALIGKVVIVQVFKKEDDKIFPETLVKFVGVLKSYTLTSYGVKFALDGIDEKTSAYRNDHVEFILFEGS